MAEFKKNLLAMKRCASGQFTEQDRDRYMSRCAIKEIMYRDMMARQAYQDKTELKKDRKKLKKQKYKHRKKIKPVYDAIFAHAMDTDWSQNCIPISIIFHEALSKKNINSIIKVGYAVEPYENYACWHCWVETEYKTYDIAMDLNRLRHPGLFDGIICMESMPPGCIRADMDTPAEIKILCKNKELIELYLRSASKFWGLRSTKKLKPIRRKIFMKLIAK